MRMLFNKLNKTVSLIFFFIAITLLTLQINPVKTYLFNKAGKISYQVTEIGFTANRVTGLFPIYLRMKDFEIYDKQGAFAYSQLVKLSWDLTALLNGNIHIRKLIISDNSEFSREPVTTPEVGTDTRTWFQQLRDVVADLPGLRVDDLSAESLKLGKQVFGNIKLVDIQAAGQWLHSQRSDLILDIQAKTYSEDTDTIKARWSFADDHLNMFIKVTETSGGILSYLTEDDLGHIEIDINGQGNLSDWQGAGLINIENLGRTNLTVDNNGKGLEIKTKNYVTNQLPIIGQYFDLSFVLATTARFFQHPDMILSNILLVAKKPNSNNETLNIVGQAHYKGEQLTAQLKASGTIQEDNRDLISYKSKANITADIIKLAGKAEFSVTAQPMQGANEAIVQFVGKSIEASGKFSLAMDKLHIEQLQCTSTNGAKLNVSGNIKQLMTTPILQIEAKASTPTVEWVDDLFSAQLELDLAANGSIINPNISANINGKQAQLGSRKLEQLYLKIKSQSNESGWQLVTTGKISDGTTTVNLPGIIKIASDDTIKFKQLIKGPDLLLDASGKLNKTELLSAKLDFNCERLDTYENWFDLDLDGEIKLSGQFKNNIWTINGNGKRIGINDLIIQDLNIKGSAKQDALDSSIDISATNFDWQQISSKKAKFTMQTKAGKGNFKLDIPTKNKRIGTSVLLSGAIDVNESKLTIQKLNITPPKLALSLGKPIKIAINPLKIGSTIISIAGNTVIRSSPLELNETYSGNVQIINFPLSFLGKINPTWNMFGQLSGRLELDGKNTDPNWDSNFNIKNLQFIQSPNSAKVNTIGNLKVKDQKLNLIIKAKGDQGSSIDLRTNIDLIEGQIMDSSPLKARIIGNGDMRVIAAFLSTGDVLKGPYKFSLNGNGTVEEPKFNGTISINGGFFENLEYGTIIKNIQMRATVKNRRITINNLPGNGIRNGNLKLNGFIEVPFKGNTIYQIAVKFNPFVIAHSDFLVSKAQGSMNIERLNKPLRLFGNITLAPTIVNFSHMKVGGTVPMIKLKEKGQTDEDIEKKRKKSIGDIDLKLNVKDRLLIRGFGLNSQWKGGIKLTGSLNDPAISGRLDMVKGIFLLLGNSMKLTKGSVRFTGKTPINPNFLVRGQRPTSYMTAYLTVDGDANEPRIKLSSDPSFPPEEILSRIMFGQAAGALSPAQAFQLASVLSSFKSGSGNLADKLGGGFGMKSLFPSGNKKSKFDTNIGDGLSDRVRVNLNPGISQGANIEAQITDNLTIDADVGAGDPAAFGLNWVKRY